MSPAHDERSRTGTHEQSEKRGRGKSAWEETLEEFEEAETGDTGAEPRRKHPPEGEAGDALSPNLRRQENAHEE